MKQLLLSILMLVAMPLFSYAQDIQSNSATSVNDIAAVTSANASVDAQDEADQKYLFDYKEPEAMPEVNVGKLIAQTVISLLVVIALVYLVVFIMKMLLGRKQQAFSKERLLNVLERNYLEPKKSIVVLRAIDRLLVVGVTDSKMNVLSEITDKEVFNNVISGDFYGYMKKYHSVEDKKET